MTNHPSPDRSSPVTHPGWCYPAFCAPGDGEVHHESHGTTHTLREFALELALVQAVDADGPGDVEVRLELHSTLNPGRVVAGYLTLDEVDQIRAALATERERAVWQTAPVVHPAVA